MLFRSINSQYLQYLIDSIAKRGLAAKAYPGCQVLIAKEGKVILQSSYGFFTYENEQAVQKHHLYDLASVTKITAPLPAIMKLFDEKKINLDAPFSNYFAEFKNTNKAEMTVRDILTHQARLQSGLPFWLQPGKRGALRENVFRNHPEEQYQVRISQDMYVKNDFKNQMIKDIVKSSLLARKEYVYSDLGFSLLPYMIERLSEKSFQEYLYQEFYKPLGAISTGFKPYERFPTDQIVPTENDLTFRKELSQGFVHDELDRKSVV